MRVKIKAIAIIVRLGRITKITLIATKRYPIGLVQQLYSNINITIIYFRISGAV